MLRGANHLELVTEATESVTAGVSVPESWDALIIENLEEVFGIEIESVAQPAAPITVSKSPKPRTAKQSVAGFPSKGSKNAGPRKVKASAVAEAARGLKRKKKVVAKAESPRLNRSSS